MSSGIGDNGLAIIFIAKPDLYSLLRAIRANLQRRPSGGKRFLVHPLAHGLIEQGPKEKDTEEVCCEHENGETDQDGAREEQLKGKDSRDIFGICEDGTVARKKQRGNEAEAATLQLIGVAHEQVGCQILIATLSYTAWMGPVEKHGWVPLLTYEKNNVKRSVGQITMHSRLHLVYRCTHNRFACI